MRITGTRYYDTCVAPTINKVIELKAARTQHFYRIISSVIWQTLAWYLFDDDTKMRVPTIGSGLAIARRMIGKTVIKYSTSYRRRFFCICEDFRAKVRCSLNYQLDLRKLFREDGRKSSQNRGKIATARLHRITKSFVEFRRQILKRTKYFPICRQLGFSSWLLLFALKLTLSSPISKIHHRMKSRSYFSALFHLHYRINRKIDQCTQARRSRFN